LPDCSQRNNARSSNSRPGSARPRSARRSLPGNSRRGHDLLMNILEVVGGEMKTSQFIYFKIPSLEFDISLRDRGRLEFSRLHLPKLFSNLLKTILHWN